MGGRACLSSCPELGRETETLASTASSYHPDLSHHFAALKQSCEVFMKEEEAGINKPTG